MQQPSLDYTKCVFCGFSPTLGSDYASKTQMKDHYINKHYKEKSCDFLRLNKNFNPPYCCHIKDCFHSTKILRDKTELLRHYARNHGMLESFYEHFNGRPEENQNNLISRNNINEPKKSDKGFNCNICHFAFASEIILERHFAAKHRAKNVNSENSLSLHEVRKASQNIAILPKEPKNSNEKSDELNRRIMTESRFAGLKPVRPGKNLSTEIMISSITYSKGDKTTNEVHEGHKEYICQHCGKHFSLNGNLKTHLLNVHKVIFHKCDYCDNRFVPSELEAHVKSVHDYGCDSCGKSFSSKTILNKHMNTHTYNVHDYLTKEKCEFCGKDFPSPQVRNQHIREIHHIQIDHKCDYCDKRYFIPAELKSHVYSVHLNQKEHICNHCNKEFHEFSNSRSKIKIKTFEHIRKVHHGGSKNIKCELCDAFLSQSDDGSEKSFQNVHEETHTPFLKDLSEEEKEKTNEELKVQLTNVHELEKTHENIQEGINKLKKSTQNNTSPIVKDLIMSLAVQIANQNSMKKQTNIENVHEGNNLTDKSNNINVHEGHKKDYVCDYCRKLFPDQIQLTSHMEEFNFCGPSETKLNITDEIIEKTELENAIQNVIDDTKAIDNQVYQCDIKNATQKIVKLETTKDSLIYNDPKTLSLGETNIENVEFQLENSIQNVIGEKTKASIENQVQLHEYGIRNSTQIVKLETEENFENDQTLSLAVETNIENQVKVPNDPISEEIPPKPHTKCNFCNKIITSKHLKAHINGVHTNIITYCCDKCDYITSYKSDLKKHLAKKHDNILENSNMEKVIKLKAPKMILSNTEIAKLAKIDTKPIMDDTIETHGESKLPKKIFFSFLVKISFIGNPF